MWAFLIREGDFIAVANRPSSAQDFGKHSRLVQRRLPTLSTLRGELLKESGDNIIDFYYFAASRLSSPTLFNIFAFSTLDLGLLSYFQYSYLLESLFNRLRSLSFSSLGVSI